MTAAAWKAVLAVVAFLAVTLWWQHEPRIPHVPLVPAHAKDSLDPCIGRPRCLTVYLAPWCPVCLNAKPVVDGVRASVEGSSAVGVRVVVGMDEMDALEAYARSYAAPTFIDAQSELQDRARIRSVPHWLVTDRSGKVLVRHAGYIHDTQAMLEKLDLSDAAGR